MRATIDVGVEISALDVRSAADLEPPATDRRFILQPREEPHGCGQAADQPCATTVQVVAAPDGHRDPLHSAEGRTRERERARPRDEARGRRWRLGIRRGAGWAGDHPASIPWPHVCLRASLPSPLSVITAYRAASS